MDNGDRRGSYAHLPEDLIKKILEAVPESVKKMNEMFSTQDAPIERGMDKLRDENLILKLGDSVKPADSVMAADGGNIIEKMSGMDILLAVAVGVDGLRSDSAEGWAADRNQYYQWQTIMPHDEATPRLCQGVMFLMELSVLSGASHDVKIMDGAHFTSVIKINSMLSAKEDRAGAEYVGALRGFLKDTYGKIIPDIPDIISKAVQDEGIVALAKYSSSRDILDSKVCDSNITLDDKTFFALGLGGGEYTRPLSVGQSVEEREKIWNDLHITCNLEIPEQDELNDRLKEAINTVRTKDGGASKQSELFFTYFKPYENGAAYRIECKKSLAKNPEKFERMLACIKRQIVYPDIREPFPQYLADLMAKSVSGGLYALQDAIRLSAELSVQENRFDLIFPYRSKP